MTEIKLTPDEAREIIADIDAQSKATHSIRRQLDALEPKRVEHTPGPWDVDSESVVVKGALLIADTWKDGAIPREVRHANARLIAAAPDFLEWAEDLIEYLDEPVTVYVQQEKMRDLMDIIAKARGTTDD